jgi:Lrp/AsnC family transcriptional regulator for asnA, asnC and gidA
LIARTIIDETDEKILRILLKNSRTSFTKIAKECKISVNAIRKRYSLLWKEGIINGEIMLVDPQSLGYECIFNAGVITKIEDESKVMEFLKSKPYICGLFKNSLEKVNIGCVISLHEIQELSGIIQDIEANPLVKHVNTTLWKKTSNVDYPENLILRNTISKIGYEHFQKPNIANLKKIELDKTDRQIAKILLQKSRTPFTKIAKELNISTKNVIQRYNKLKGTVLTSPTITINLERLGYNAMVDLQIKITNRSQIQEILAEILKIPNVLVVLEFVGGDLDLFPIIALRDYSELFRLKQQLSTIQGIEHASMYLNEPYQAWPLNMFASLLSNHG